MHHWIYIFSITQQLNAKSHMILSIWLLLWNLY